MDDVLAWMATHPLESEEANVMFWIALIGLIIIRIVLWFGGPGSGKIKG